MEGRLLKKPRLLVLPRLVFYAVLYYCTFWHQHESNEYPSEYHECRHCSMTTAGPSSVHVSWHHYSALCPSLKRCSQAPVVPQQSTDIVSPHCVTEVFWFWTHCALEVKLFNRLVAAGLTTQPDSDAIQPPQIPWPYHFVLLYWQDHYLILICLDPLCFIKNSSNHMDGNGQSCE